MCHEEEEEEEEEEDYQQYHDWWYSTVHVILISDSLPCTRIGSTDRCIFNLGKISGENAKAACGLMGGSFPVIQNQAGSLSSDSFNHFDQLLSNGEPSYLLSLHFPDGTNPVACSGADCSSKGLSWKTFNGALVPLSSQHVAQVNNELRADVMQDQKASDICFKVTKQVDSQTNTISRQIESVACTTELNAFCEQSMIRVPFGSADEVPGTFVCPVPAIPADTNLEEKSSKPYCIGRKLQLECKNLGSWNRFIVNTHVNVPYSLLMIDMAFVCRMTPPITRHRLIALLLELRPIL